MVKHCLLLLDEYRDSNCDNTADDCESRVDREDRGRTRNSEENSNREGLVRKSEEDLQHVADEAVVEERFAHSMEESARVVALLSEYHDD